MRISDKTLQMLANLGDKQAINTLKTIENETAASLLETEIHFQKGPGIFHTSVGTRKRTVMGMPAMTPELQAQFLANRKRP